MRLEQFTIKAQESVLAAQREAEVRHHQQVEPEHLLWVLISQADGLVPPLLQRLEVDLERLKRRLDAELKKIPEIGGPAAANVYVSFILKRAFDQARLEAEKLKDEFIST